MTASVDKSLVRTIIVEDEPNNQQLLANLIERFCPGVEVLGMATTALEGADLIRAYQPDLVFLDIQLPHHNGFELFKWFPDQQFEVIFTTAHAEFAVKAIRLAALDYLLKPISLWELTDALERFRKKRARELVRLPNEKQVAVVEEHLQNTTEPRLALPCVEGYEVVAISAIICCEAEGSYTRFHFVKGQASQLVSKNIKQYEELLEEYQFRRVHRSHLVNPNHVTRIIRGKIPSLVMSDGRHVDVSRRRRAILDTFVVNNT